MVPILCIFQRLIKIFCHKINNWKLHKIGSVLTKSGLAIQFPLKFCNQNVIVVRGLRLEISVLAATQRQSFSTVLQCMIGPLLSLPQLVGSRRISSLWWWRRQKKPPTTPRNLEILSFLAYQTYSVAREKTSKATEEPESPEENEQSEDNMDNFKRTLGDAGAFLKSTVQVLPLYHFTNCQTFS